MCDFVSGVVALVPAHNEQGIILDSIRGLQNQTLKPSRIVVVADNCTDNTISIARETGVEVFETVDNTHKKAGALNQALEKYLEGEEDFVFVQDADSVIFPDFLENAIEHFNTRGKELGAVGGTFRALPIEKKSSLSQRVLWRLQDNEYARYQRDVERLNGKCLVVTGTAALFRKDTLEEVRSERGEKLPRGTTSYYDTDVLTEDNELSFAIQHLGYNILAPHDCLLKTDAMLSVKELYNQRLRWKRGAVENCVQYGLTRITLPYWGRQLLTMVGVVVTAIYLATLIWAITTSSLAIHPFWLGVTLIFVLERFVTVSRKGLREQLLSATMWEIPYEIFLQGVHGDAYLRSVLRLKKEW